MLSAILEKKERLVIGLMSGTSADGIDAALVRLTGQGLSTRIQLLAFDVLCLSPAVRERLLAAMGPAGRGNRDLCLLSSYLGELFAHACGHIAQKAGVPLAEVDLVGLHGQTLYHHPAPEAFPGFTVTGTLQVGSAAVVAERTGLTVVSDFRSRDMAVGGQGAPLAPYLDFLLYHHRARGRIVLNIGGIANATSMLADSSLEAVRAFDTGPGNCLMDAAVTHYTGGKQTCDTDGRIALSGKIHRGLLEALLRHPYFPLPPPKSADRTTFGADYLRAALAVAPGISPQDVVATLTALTAQSIGTAVLEHCLQRGRYEEMILSGGGAKNPVLVQGIRQALPKLFITDADEYDIPGKAKEAVLMAFLAHETILGRAGNVPAATGAKRPVVLGSVTPGSPKGLSGE